MIPQITLGTDVRVEFTTDEGTDYHVGTYGGLSTDGDHVIFTRIAGDLKVEVVDAETVTYLDVA